jgi:8-oxo-dGTP pyrophosphatase MutT (NUDIX family)
LRHWTTAILPLLVTIFKSIKQRKIKMTKVLYGERISRQGELRLGCSAAIFDAQRRILLTRRADNGQWCLPGGGMDAGESAAEACEREVWEETGLRVRVTRLVGVYSYPDQLVVYPDGNKAHIVALHFETEILSGAPTLSNETTDFGYFTLEEIDGLEMFGRHKERILDTLEKHPAALIK